MICFELKEGDGLDIKVLRYFLRLCEGKSYAAVAAEAYISKQAVSQSIQSLERTCGAPLFIRTSEGLVLTGEGEMLKRHAAVIVDQWDSAMAALHPASPKYKLRVGYGIMTYNMWNEGHIPNFMNANPDIEVHYRLALPDELFGALDNGQLDLVVSNSCMSNERYSHILLRRSRIYAVVRREVFADVEKPYLHYEDLSGKTILFLPSNQRFRDAFTLYMQKIGVNFEARVAQTHELLSAFCTLYKPRPEACILHRANVIDFCCVELRGRTGVSPPQKDIYAISSFPVRAGTNCAVCGEDASSKRLICQRKLCEIKDENKNPKE